MMVDVTLAILAGGQGSRMGAPKAELEIDGKPILKFLLDQLKWPGATMLVTAPGREHPAGFESFDREVVDPVAGTGPLQGVLTALEHLLTPLLAVTTVDMPGVNQEHLNWLESRLREQGDCLGVMCARGEIIEPFPSVFRKAANDAVAQRLASGRHSVYSLSQMPGFAVVPAPAEWDAQVWTNLNTRADVQTFLRQRV
jgi:molybdopterin-guanine dinucleotide biosynthesis protein A